MKKWYERLTIAREAQGLKKSHLAKMIGVQAPVMTEWEAGLIASPTAANILKICEALKITPEWLMNGDESTTPSVNQSAEIKRAIQIIESLDEASLKQLLAIINTFATDTSK